MKAKIIEKKIRKWSEFLEEAAICKAKVFPVGTQFVYDEGSLPSGMTGISAGDILNLQRENGMSSYDVPGSAEDWVRIDGNPGDGSGLDLTVEQTLTAAQKQAAAQNINDRPAQVDSETETVVSMGYKVLNPNLRFAEQVNSANTIYEIKDEFDLNGGSVTIPNNCTLKFNGGKLVNGILNLSNGTLIQAENVKIFDNVTFLGTGEMIANVEWFIGTYESSFEAQTTKDCADEFMAMFGNGFSSFAFNEERYYPISKTINIQGVIKTFGKQQSKLQFGTWPGYENTGVPTIYSNSVSTLIDYTFNDTNNQGKSQLMLEGFALFCRKPFSDMSENDTPILYIHNTTEINYGSINLSIKSIINSFTASSIVQGATSQNAYFFTRTGILLEAEYTHITSVNIGGNIEYVRTGIKTLCNKTHNVNNWLTQVTINATTRCVYGHVGDARPVIVSGIHQSVENLSIDNEDAYITASDVYLQGYIWDVGVGHDTTGLAHVKYASASNAKNEFSNQPFKALIDRSKTLELSKLYPLVVDDNALNYGINADNILPMFSTFSFSAKYGATLESIESATSFDPTISNNYLKINNKYNLFNKNFLDRKTIAYAGFASAENSFFTAKVNGVFEFELSISIKYNYYPASSTYLIVYMPKTDVDTSNRYGSVEYGEETFSIDRAVQTVYGTAFILKVDLSASKTLTIKWKDVIADAIPHLLPTIYIPYPSSRGRIPSLSKAQLDDDDNTAGGFGKSLVLVKSTSSQIWDRIAVINGDSNSKRRKLTADGRSFANIFGSVYTRPSSLQSYNDLGYQYFDTTLGKPIFWNGSAWVEEDGEPADIKRTGTSAQRPSPANIGFNYFDTTLGKPIY